MTALQSFIEDEEAAVYGPPHNLEAEQAFLGALLYDNELFHRVADWLKPGHFYDPVHCRIFETAAEIIGHGDMVDAIVLKSRFIREDWLFEDGTTYLAILMEGAVSGAAAFEYAKIILELALRRQLVDLSRYLADNAQSSSDFSARELIAEIEAKLTEIQASGGARRGLRGFNEGLAESLQATSAAYERAGGLVGLSTGIKALDAETGGLSPTDLIILAGRPSMGKTSLATNIAFNVAKAYQSEGQPDGTRKTVRGGVVGFYSLEMSAEQLSTRLLADYTGVPAFVMKKGSLSEAAYTEIADAAQQIQNLPLYIDDTGGMSIANIESESRRLKRTHGLDLIVVDYLQLISLGTRGRGGRVEELSEITRRLKALAKELNVPVIALSQLSRQVENRPDKKPQLSDLRESGSIEQDADVVCFVYREAYYKEREKPSEGTPEFFAWEEEFKRIKGLAEVIIGKQRHGPIGTAVLAFNGALTRFSDPVEEA